MVLKGHMGDFSKSGVSEKAYLRNQHLLICKSGGDVRDGIYTAVGGADEKAWLLLWVTSPSADWCSL